MPYAKPVRPDKRTSRFGVAIAVPASCARQNMIAEAKRHQNRERWSFDTRKSEPMPLVRRPVKLQNERIETCIAWRFSMKAGVVDGSKCFHKACASLPMLLDRSVGIATGELAHLLDGHQANAG